MTKIDSEPAHDRVSAGGSPGTATETAPARVAASSASASAADLVSKDAARYQVLREHGRGGIGRVLAAVDLELDRTVAIKELQQLSHAAEARFVREARITARLEHPSIVPVHEAGCWPDGTPFYAMKLIAGRSLKELVDGCSTLDARLKLLPNVLAVAEAIAYAHNEGVIHRDLKPSNVIVGDYGETIVIDWGLAKDLRGDDLDAPSAGPYRTPEGDHLTQAGDVLGTPAYMPPEQARGEDVDERADVYALGAMLYNVLAGRPPFDGATSADVLRKVLAEPAPELRSSTPAPYELNAIVAKAMASEPARRYQTARELADDLRRYQTGKLVAAYSYGPTAILRHWIAQHRGIAATALAGVLALGAVGAYSLHRVVSARDAAERASKSAQQRSTQLVLAQAVGALPTDPTASAAWLKEYPQDGTDARVAAVTLADAASRGVASHVLRGHEEAVGTAEFLADTDHVVSSSKDRSLRYWDLRARTVRVLATDLSDAGLFALSPDRRSCAYPTSTGSIRTIDLHSLETRTLGEHRGVIFSIAISSEGAVATAGADGKVFVWRTPDSPPTELVGHSESVKRVHFIDGGARVLSSSDDLTIRLWSVETATGVVIGETIPWAPTVLSADESRAAWATAAGRVKVRELSSAQEQVLDAHGEATDLAFAPNGRYFASFSRSHRVRIWGWDSSTHRYARLVYDEEVGPMANSLAFDASSTRLAIANLDGSLMLIDPETGNLHTITSGAPAAYVVAWSPNGALLAGLEDGSVRVWRSDLPESKTFRGHSDAIFHLRVAPGGVLATDSRDRTLRTWDPDVGALKSFVGHSELVYGIAFSHDGAFLASSSWDGTVRVWDVASGAEIATVTKHEGIAWDVAFSPDSSMIASAGADGVVALCDRASLRCHHLLGHDGEVRTVAFSPSGSHFATAGQDGRVYLWDVRTRSSKQVSTHSGPVALIAFSHDGSVLASAGSGDLHLVDLHDDSEDLVHGSGGRIRALAFSPADRHLAWGGDSGELHVRDLTNQNTTRVYAHRGGLRDLAFDSEAKLLASVGRDGVLRTWDVAADFQCTAYRGHSDEIRATAFLDDRRVATAGIDGTVRVWRLRSTAGYSADTLPSRLEHLTTAVIEEAPNRSGFQPVTAMTRIDRAH